MPTEEKIYNMTELAEKLGVPRQTIYYWIEKGWVRPRRDYRNYPVFTEGDVENIQKWKGSIREVKE